MKVSLAVWPLHAEGSPLSLYFRGTLYTCAGILSRWQRRIVQFLPHVALYFIQRNFFFRSAATARRSICPSRHIWTPVYIRDSGGTTERRAREGARVWVGYTTRYRGEMMDFALTCIPRQFLFSAVLPRDRDNLSPLRIAVYHRIIVWLITRSCDT